MSVLVLIPPARLALSEGAQAELWWHARSLDGLAVATEGWLALEDCPRAERVVVVLPESEVAWVEVQLPKVAANRMRAALVGVLEEHLLEDPELTHLALGPKWAGQWVAALHRPWLQDLLGRLRAAGLEADAVVSATQPGEHWSAHARIGSAQKPELVLSGPLGVGVWPLEHSLIRSRFNEIETWSSEPAAAQALGQLQSGPVALLTQAQRTVRQATTGINLLQFELAPQLKASRAIAAAWQNLRQPHWRGWRRGLVALALVQIVGLNMAAWRGEREIAEWEARSVALLQETFPAVTVVLDPMLQMEREVASLRQAAGQPGATDLDAWLDVLARHWPPGAEPLSAVRQDAQGVSLESRQWPPGAREALMAHAQTVGWAVQEEGSRLRMAPAVPRNTGAVASPALRTEGRP